jgi:tetratricopeptide (TPR) repeat protein
MIYFYIITRRYMQFRGLCYALILLFISGCASQKELPQKDEKEQIQQRDKDKAAALQHFIDGSVLESKGEYAQAIVEYQDALRYDKDPAIYYALAKNYSSLGKHALAAQMADEAVRLDPANITYRQTLAEIYVKTYQLDLAVGQYHAILKIDSNDVSSMYNIARLTQVSKPLQALEMYDKIVQRTGPDWDVLLQIVEINTGLQRYAQAAVGLEQMMKIDPGNIAVRKNLGEMYVRSEQFDKALEIFNDLIERDPKSLELRGALAGLYLQKGDWNKAREQFDVILKNDSLSADARFRIGMAYLTQVQKDTSLLTSTIQQFETFLMQYPEDWRTNSLELRGMLAELYVESGNWEKAKSLFESILKRDSLTADIRFRIAMAYFMQGQKDTALLPDSKNQLTEMMSLYPKDWRPMFYLGLIHLIRKNNDTALVFFEKSVELAPWNGDALWYTGSLYFDKREYAKTVNIMERARKEVPKDARMCLILGLGYSRLGRNDDAVDALKRGAELDPKNINIVTALGDTYNAMKKFKESDDAYEDALKIDAHYPVVLNNYAYSLSERDEQLERAMKMSRESLEKDSANASYLDTYGWILYRIKRYDEALVYITKAVDLGETNAVVYEHLGDVYYQLKNQNAAKTWWKKAADQDPSNDQLRRKVERGKP